MKFEIIIFYQSNWKPLLPVTQTLCIQGNQMILLSTILIPIMILIIYLFFSTSPKNKRKREVTNINLIIFGVGICGCVGISLYSYFTTGKSVDSAWWPVAAFFGSIIVFSVVLFIGGIYRNFIHFKKNA